MKQLITNLWGNYGTLPQECKRIRNCKEADVIVSLTSYPPRFPTLHKVIENILGQSLKPLRVCLWIAEQDKAFLTGKVWELTKSGLEIYFVRDFKSYNKIIHCQAMFPDSVIVTADDDVVYPSDWLRLLWANHCQSPEKVICHRARYMTFQPTGNVNPYWLWPVLEREIESPVVFPLGVGGVLYPGRCFHEDISRDEIFTDLCRHGDDIWLKAMTLLNSIPCRKIHYYPRYFKHIKASQKVNLKTVNLGFKNDVQVQNVFQKYGILHKLQKLTGKQVPIKLQA